MGKCDVYYFGVSWVITDREFWDLEPKMADEWCMKDLIDSAIREVSQHFDSFGWHGYCSGRV